MRLLLITLDPNIVISKLLEQLVAEDTIDTGDEDSLGLSNLTDPGVDGLAVGSSFLFIR